MPTTLTRRHVLLGLLPAAAALRFTGAGAESSSAPPPPASAAPVRLSANENPYGPSPSARRALAASVETAWQYPSTQHGVLKSLIAGREDLTPEHVMLGEGSGEILRIAAIAFSGGDGEVVTPWPTFAFLPEYARRLGATLREIPLDEAMNHDLRAMDAAIGPRTRLVYVCNPNNPTGTFLEGDVLRPFVSAAARRAPVVVDEAYADLVEDWRRHTLTDRVLADEDVIVTRTFSKLHGLAGLRIGYALAKPALIQRLERYRMSMLNLPGLAAATASYEDLEFQAWSRRKIREALALTTAALDQIGRPHTGAGPVNFVFFDTGGPLPDFAAAMREQGFLVGRPFPPYDSWCRVSMGTVEQMEAFAQALRGHYAG
jgi:histidinol-phosphate aminotransferase